MDAARLLRQAGKKVTPARLEVLNSLIRLGCLISQADLSRLPQLKRCDRVTLYRTLNVLRKSGLVHAVQGTDGTWRFCAHKLDGAGCPGNHPHFLCLSCGRMDCLIGQKMPRIEVPLNVKVQGKQFVVYGQCADCALRGKRKSSGMSGRRESRA
jgi:Fur family ferric uptake transcriptional regulator